MAPRYFRAALLGCSVFIGVTATPALGQGRYSGYDVDPFSQRGYNPFEAFSDRIGEMTNDRLRAYRETRQELIDGWCKRRLSNLNSLHAEVERRQNEISKEDLAAYRQALAQERAYPCPPGGPPTPPPPPPPPPPPVVPEPKAVMRDRIAPSQPYEGPSMTYDPGPMLPGPMLLDPGARVVADPPPPAQPTPPPPPAAQPVAAAPAQGLTQDEINEVARQQSHFDVVERERKMEKERNEAAALGRIGNSVLVSVGLGEMEIPATNYGFVRDGPVPTPEVAALTGQQRFPAIFVEGIASFATVGDLVLRYSEGDARSSVDLPAGEVGTARGFPYSAESPGGSTGIAGRVPLSAAEESTFKDFGGGVRRSAFPHAKPKDPFDIFYGIEGVIRDRDHVGEVSITTPVIANQLLEQDVDERELHVLAGAKAEVPLGNIARFLIGAEASVYYYDFDLKSLETIDQNFGPLDDRSYTRSVEDGRTGVGYTGTIRGQIILNLGEPKTDGSARAELFLAARAAYSSDRAQILNPPNGDFVQAGGTSGLVTNDAIDWSVSLGFRVFMGGSGRFKF
ncbi:hypothetical protein [Sphingopyxis sp. QXT-31]|uniref:hypothetical protein n=1 Tax=Sphingopyxis sp. QXT-31 TaxID=1357916 RepID=UPI0012EC3B2D|nr:hypothetical protein [Sphingopyxis sp. QXT-31]